MAVLAEIPVPEGLRERNKREKLARIVAAARALFARNGFEGTTVQAVARQAEIGAGTLFLYAKTKEDLLVLVFKQELSRVVEESFASLPRGRPLLEQFLHLYGAVTEHHARNMALGRPFAKEVMFVGAARRPEIAAFMGAWLKRIAAVVEAAQARGEIAASVDPRLLASASFGLYFNRLQSWVGGFTSRPRVETEVRQSLALLLTGLTPQNTKPSRERKHAGKNRRRAAARPA